VTTLVVLDDQTGQPAEIITDSDVAHDVADGKDVNNGCWSAGASWPSGWPPAARQERTSALASGAAIVVADLTSSTFCDTAGVQEMLLGHKAAGLPVSNCGLWCLGG
jgi:hypothetical protein